MKNLVLLAGVVFTLILLSFSTERKALTTLSLSNQSDQKPKSSDKPTCILTPLNKIKNNSGENKSDHLYLNIYPVKKSGNNIANDFDLIMEWADSGKYTMTKKISPDLITRQSTYYAKYFKQAKVEKENIPIGYQLTLSQKEVKKNTNLSVCWSHVNHKVSFTYLLGPTPAPREFILYSDSISICKSPPDKCNLNAVMVHTISKALDKVYAESGGTELEKNNE